MKILWKTHTHTYIFLSLPHIFWTPRQVYNKQIPIKKKLREKEREWWNRVSLLIALHGSTNVNANGDYLETLTIATNKIENV